MSVRRMHIADGVQKGRESTGECGSYPFAGFTFS